MLTGTILNFVVVRGIRRGFPWVQEIPFSFQSHELNDINEELLMFIGCYTLCDNLQNY